MVKALLEVLSAMFTGALSSLVINTFCEALWPTPTSPNSTDVGFTLNKALLELVVENAFACDPQPESPVDITNVMRAAVRKAATRAAAYE